MTAETKKKAPKKPSSKAKKAPAAASKTPVALQPSLNLGMVGHVDHGKTTLTEALSGKWTDTHSEEIKRGITIRLGYADVSIYKDKDGKLYSSAKDETDELVRKISIVDAPGHESLMATMLSGAAIMHGALLLIAANEACPQPQTREHLMALEISGIEHVIIVQNKIDLVSRERAVRNYGQIKEFLKGTKFEHAPIVPISAQHRVNTDVLLRTIVDTIPIPFADEDKDPLMFIARSFDVNKPGITPDKLVGGVLGGALKQGVLRVGDEVEIRPGKVYEEANQLKTKPLITKIRSTMTGGQKTDRIGPGGTVAIMTGLDPSIVKSDALGGHMVGLPGKLPPVWQSLQLETHLLERVVGAQEDLKVDQIKVNEILMLNVNSSATVMFVQDIGKNMCRGKLKLPICAQLGARVTISRRIGTRFRLIGFGIIQDEKK
ncbi:MAG: translation initiation factor IF-2 subunit gamma [Nanoarchaeota archaeon]